MRTDVVFKDFKNIPHLREFVMNHATNGLEKFEHGQPFHTNILISSGTTRRESHPTIFECLLVVHGPSLERPIVTKKRSNDFYQAVRQCIHTAAELLGDQSKIRVHRRHKKIWHHDDSLTA